MERNHLSPLSFNPCISLTIKEIVQWKKREGGENFFPYFSNTTLRVESFFLFVNYSLFLVSFLFIIVDNSQIIIRIVKNHLQFFYLNFFHKKKITKIYSFVRYNNRNFDSFRVTFLYYVTFEKLKYIVNTYICIFNIFDITWISWYKSS